jgi:hypothetical protein
MMLFQLLQVFGFFLFDGGHFHHHLLVSAFMQKVIRINPNIPIKIARLNTSPNIHTNAD